MLLQPAIPKPARPFLFLVFLFIAFTGWIQIGGAQSLPNLTYYVDIPYGNLLPGDPLFDEQTFDVLYPEGACPGIPGCDGAPSPVAILLHGGNTNSPYFGLEEVSPIVLQLLLKKFVVVIPNFHVIDFNISESWKNASKDIARCIQFLRYNSATMNILPDKVFLQGHSSGGFQTYYLGLGPDMQNFLSTDPVDWESSRPNYMVPWGAPTLFTCLDVNAPTYFPSWASQYFFGLPSFAQVPFADLLSSSPWIWLNNPQLFNRTYTPPMCLVYNLDAAHICGTIGDTHDGEFGNIMKEAIDRFCMFHPTEAVCGKSTLISNANIDTAIIQVTDWMAQRAAR